MCIYIYIYIWEGLLQDGLRGPLVRDDGLELGVLALALLGSLVISVVVISIPL